MEKALPFSVFKEKIIKTDELLHVVLERNQDLEKAQKWITHLKTKLELSKNEINKLKLRNETLVSIEKNYHPLTDKYDKLQFKFNRLENESNNTINSLHAKYQLANQELAACKEKILMLSEVDDPENSLSVKGQTSVKRSKKKKSPVKKKENDEGQLNLQKINQLQAEKEKLLNEKTELQLEVFEFKKKCTSLESREDIDIEEYTKIKEDLHELKNSVKVKEEEITRLIIQRDEVQVENERLTIENSLSRGEVSKLKKKCIKHKEEIQRLQNPPFSDLECQLTATIELKTKEVNTLLKKIESLEREKVNLDTENETLRIENSTYKVEISMLHQSCSKNSDGVHYEEPDLDVSLEAFQDDENNDSIQVENEENQNSSPLDNLREYNVTPTNEDIFEIMNQMVMPPMISPLPEEACYEEINSTPIEHNPQFLYSSVDMQNRNEELSTPNTYLENTVKERRKCIKKKQRIAKRKRKQADLFGALLALKKANIDFVISSNPLLPSPISARSINFHQFRNDNFKPIEKKKSTAVTRELELSTYNKHIEKKKPTTVTKELKCCLSSCDNTHMVLKESSDDEDTLLLGFVGVKNETSGIDSRDPICVASTPMKQTRAFIKRRALLPESSEDGENEAVVKKTSKNRKASINNHVGACEREEEIDNMVYDQNTIDDNANDSREDHSRSNNVNERLQRICDPPDEDSDSYPTASKSSGKYTRKKTCDPPLVVRKSKRNITRNFFVSMRKKKKPEGNRNLTLTECAPPYLDVGDGKENNSTLCKNTLSTSTQLLLNSKPISESNGAKSDDFIFKKPFTKVKSPKTAFKRPVCSTRQSQRLLTVRQQLDQNSDSEIQREEDNIPLESPKSPSPDPEDVSHDELAIIPSESPKSPSPEPEDASNGELVIIPLESPKSPTSDPEDASCDKPVFIPLESPKSPTPDSEDASDDELVIIPSQSPKSPTADAGAPSSNKPAIVPIEKMPTSKIEVLFSKLILFSEEEEALNEVVREFSSQEPEYIAEAVLERISVDYHDSADTKYHPAPLMTHAQRTMLGFMSKLEKTNVAGVLDCYVLLSERRLLTCSSLQELGPITRLYLAVCKLKKQLTKMRKMCCDVFYFCGDLAVPFLFTVLTSWTEVLPHAGDSKDFPLAKVLVQIVYTRDCKQPGYNLMPLKDLLIKFYGYPTERWDYDEFFKDRLDEYLRNPSRVTDFPLILYCKSRPEKWVYETIEEHLKPMVSLGIQDNFKATLVILIGNLYNRFSSKSEFNYLPTIRKWLLSLITDETPEIVKRCVYVSLKRLKKK